MLLWVGLGNPEPSMQRNRHNIGFMVLETLVLHYGFSSWRCRFRGKVAEGRIGNQKILALLPQTYMNRSGESVQEVVAFYKILPHHITVFHDELDVAPGRLRVKQGGSAAGHNGLRSIDRCLGTSAYQRVRLGIGHPGHKERVCGWVLGDFTKTEYEQWVAPMLTYITEAAPFLAEGQADQFMTRVALLEKNNGV